MADITKCKGTNCPLKKDCYRFIANSSERQSWFFNVPYDFKNKKCEYFYKINNKTND